MQKSSPYSPASQGHSSTFSFVTSSKISSRFLICLEFTFVHVYPTLFCSTEKEMCVIWQFVVHLPSFARCLYAHSSPGLWSLSLL